MPSPISRLSAEQIKVLLQRIVKARVESAQAGRSPMDPSIQGFTRGMANETLAQDPLKERIYGQLLRSDPAQRGKPPLTMPIEEARAQYFANPNAYTPAPTSRADVKHMYAMPGGAQASDPEVAKMFGLDPEALASNIAYERMKFAPIIPPSVARNRRLMTDTLEGSIDRGPVEQLAAQRDKEALLGQMTAMGMPAQIEKPMARADMDQNALMLQDMWRAFGGKRGMNGRQWDDLMKASRWSNKFGDPKDYFVFQATRLLDNPGALKKDSKREYNLLKTMFDAYKQNTGVDLEASFLEGLK